MQAKAVYPNLCLCREKACYQGTLSITNTHIGTPPSKPGCKCGNESANSLRFPQKNEGRVDTHKLKTVTIFDVAQASGVSYSTVSRVLNGFEFVKESTRQRVLETAATLGYVANSQARSLAGGKSRVIGLLVPTLDNGYINEISRGIDEALAKADYDLMLYTTHHEKNKELKYAKAIANGLSDGLLLLVPLVPARYLAALRQQKFAHVLIDQRDESGESATVDAANRQGALKATRYLLGLGHRRIGFIGGSPDLNSARERFEGYRAALREYGVEVDDRLNAEGDFNTERAYNATRHLLARPEPPTALFAANDLSAFGAMNAVREAGLRIPEDVSVVGFDDIPQASITYPKLTTVHQPLVQMGRTAVELLLEQLEQPGRPPRHVTLATHLVIRDSCRKM